MKNAIKFKTREPCVLKTWVGYVNGEIVSVDGNMITVRIVGNNKSGMVHGSTCTLHKAWVHPRKKRGK